MTKVGIHRLPIKGIGAATWNDYARRHPGPAAGDRMPDGTIYAGVSPATGALMFVLPGREPPEGWYAALERANGDWCLPTKEELQVIYGNRRCGALKDAFNESGNNRDGWYWTISEKYPDAIALRFSDGLQSPCNKLTWTARACLVRRQKRCAA